MVAGRSKQSSKAGCYLRRSAVNLGIGNMAHDGEHLVLFNDTEVFIDLSQMVPDLACHKTVHKQYGTLTGSALICGGGYKQVSSKLKVRRLACWVQLLRVLPIGVQAQILMEPLPLSDVYIPFQLRKQPQAMFGLLLQEMVERVGKARARSAVTISAKDKKRKRVNVATFNLSGKRLCQLQYSCRLTHHVLCFFKLS